MIFHGNHEHRLRAIAVALVERAVDRVLDIRRQEVRIVDDERITGDRAVAGEAGAIHRNREFDERRFGLRVGLGEPEAEALRSLLVELDEIQAPGIRLGDAPRLGQDQLEQRLNVAFRAERDADPRQLADLARAMRGLAARARRLGPRSGFAESGPDGDQQPPGARRIREEPRQEFGRQRFRHVGLAVPSESDNGAARIHECPHDIDGKEGAAFRVEQQDRRAIVHDGHVPGLADRTGLHLCGLERRRDGVRAPHRRMEQDVSHGLTPKPKRASAPSRESRRATSAPRRVTGFVRTISPAAGLPRPQRNRGK